MLVSTAGILDSIVLQRVSPILKMKETHESIAIIGTFFVDEVGSCG